MNVMEKKNTELMREFNRYIREHPEFAGNLPNKAIVVMQLEGDASFNAWSNEIAVGAVMMVKHERDYWNSSEQQDIVSAYNGREIPKEYHEKIFGLFYRLDNDMNGTGVGLSVVRKVMQFHWGGACLGRIRTGERRNVLAGVS